MKRLAIPLALLLVVAVHVAITVHFVPLELVFGPDPIVALDYDMHYRQTLRAVEAFRASGRLWSYDPFLLAGQPSGVIFDANNKGIEVIAVALDLLRVPPHRAYNLTILVLHLLAPLSLFGVARLWGASRPACVLAAALGSAIWYFDSLSHWCLFVGMISWGSAAHLWLWPLAVFYRWISTRRPWLLVVVFALLAALHTFHAYVFWPLVLPMVVLYLRARKDLRRWEHLAVWGIAAAVVVVNLHWLGPAIRLWHYVLDSGRFLDATPAYLLYDYLGLTKEFDVQGAIAVRSGFRFLVYGAAACGLLAWRKARDERLMPVAVGLGALLLAAYVGGLFDALRQIQPYRLSLPAVYLAIVPASVWLVDALRSWVASRPSRAAIGLVSVLCLVALSKLARDVLYFFPGWLPRITRIPSPLPPHINAAVELGTWSWPEPFDYRLSPIEEPNRRAVDYVRQLEDGKGRWLVEWWLLGERLAWASRAQLIGGFRLYNLQHSDANMFRRWPDGAPPEPDELRRYLEQYNVRWLIVSNPMPRLEARRDLLELVGNVEGHRYYRTTIAPSWFMDGSGGEVRASVDRLEVRGSRGGDLVLKYHYLEGLECRPGCELYRAEVPGDRVGFIGVRGAPADFAIVHP